MRSTSAAAKRVSIRMLRASIHPSPSSAVRNAARPSTICGSFSAPPSSMPIRRIGPLCCARAAIGHSAEPPSSVMSVRRSMCPPGKMRSMARKI
jgi:hypothetical protein